MSFTLEKVVPWGRSFDEYVSMFSLSDTDLDKRILGCGDGPAGFNAKLTQRGGMVVSVDPIYQFSSEQIRARIDETCKIVIDQTIKNQDEFVWNHIHSIDALKKIRMKAMEEFLNDFKTENERYVVGELPVLPFKNQEFDLALCSHLLFLYSEQQSFNFHIGSIKELCRIASEVRIFPLLELGAKKSRHLDDVIQKLEESGYMCNIKKVSYEFQKGGNEMLQVKSSNNGINSDG
ncbi:MAG: SAM-dependent methyltransferase [Pseudomonadota bacterium]